MTAYLVAALIVLVVLAGLLFLGLGATLSHVESLVWPKGITRLDDRDNEVSVSEPRQFSTEQFPHSLYDKFFSHWAKRHKPRASPLLLLVLGVMGGAPILLLTIWYFGLSLPQLPWWLFFVGCLVFSVFASRCVRQAVLGWQSDAVVSFGHCASCGYGLRQLQSDPDGCVACPECGAAWKPRWLDVA